MSKGPVIAFDGPAASGKGTLASQIARDYGLPYLDTGLLYRAVGQIAHAHGISPERATGHITDELLSNAMLRGREAGERASQVAVIPEVREALKQYQIDFAHRDGGAVLDGRDIGTVIAPDATIKLYVTADAEVRAKRRWLQLVQKDPGLSFAAILEDIRIRDERDSSRANAPLAMAQDALLLDTTDLGIDTAIERARSLVADRCGPPLKA